jgi:nitronate monooxygenase
VIAAGGINSFARTADMFRLGASGVQAGAKDIITFMSSAGLPARAVLTPWLKRYLAREDRLRGAAFIEGTPALQPL